MALIREEEISYSDLSLVDPVGRLFHWNDGIYRGIYPNSAELVRDLFASGCLQELMRRGFFPQSQITEHVMEGFDFVVEHKTVPYVIYPHEWSFDMFRDASLAVLEVVEICAKFGWDIKDCHPQNVLFSGNQPLFVDLGSFRKKPRSVGFEKGLDFLRCYWRPLYVWASGESFLAQRLISSGSGPMPDLSWWLYRHSSLRVLGAKKCARLAKWSAKWARKAAKLLRHGNVVSWLSPSLASRLPASILAKNPSLLRRKIARLTQPLPSQWDDYHSEHIQNGAIISTPRFDRILEIIRLLDCASATELAGNQGLLTLLIGAKTKLDRVVCTDYSSSAINRFYNYCRSHTDKLNARHLQGAVLDFMLPERTFGEASPSERLKSDLVIALAVTHHLILTQNYPLREILKTIRGYTRRFAMIEFMPLGLWNGHNAPPVPDWYTKDWFQQIFTEFFDLVAVEELEKNRILFVGRLKAPRSEIQAEDPSEYFDTKRWVA